MLDRIDIHIEAPRVPYRVLSADTRGETSQPVRGRVNRARSVHRERFTRTKIFCNARMGPRHLKQPRGLGEGGANSA